LAWTGERGITTWRPGMWVKRASGDCEWYLEHYISTTDVRWLFVSYKAPCPTTPAGMRITSPPQLTPVEPDRYLYLAASFTI
jgi:hypothetical protein